ncbi:NRPS [Paraconiothyrium brasiliense]|uniref:NRPS n=1 Tax=Paraconiothyrium brasiliense TaxID=300254 RepID=A0ABR3S2E7_9PLEO
MGMEKSGANVRIFAMDVANTKSVQGVVTTIRETMPPIGGVCNAAMVLSDQTFADTDADEFETVTRPKVDGSECLDQIFYSDRSLDFFILFSSLASVIGNSGQGNYNAANMYMASLARRRKSRGLSASIIDIGMVVGLGYLSRNPRFVAYFERMNFMPLSESDLHKLFVEAITVGKPGVEEDMELIVGLSGVLRMPHSNTSSERSKDPPKWFKDPRFSHLLEDDRKDVRPVLSSNATASVTQQLSKAKDRSSIQMIVETAIAAQLALQLQMSADNIHPQSPLTSLGIDSLIAVDLRMWLLTTLDADVPLFKMLNGITIGEIGTHITQQLCTALLGNSSSEADTASQPPPKQSPASDGPVSSLDLLRDSTLISSNTEESEQELNTDDHTSPEFPPTQDVKPVAILREAPLSAGQASLLFMQTYTNDKCISNVSIRFRLQGKLDSAKFEDAILAVIHNHEILRTAFLWRPETNDYVQVVLRHSPFRFHRRFGDTDLEHENARLLTIPFDLGKGHTMEATLISQSAAVHYVIFCYHHIVMDGISWQIFTHELNRAYSGESISAPLGHQIDFVRRESDKLVESRWAAALDYWSQEFADPPETLPLLPISKVPCRQHLDVYSTSTVSLRLCAATAAQIRRMSRNLNITPFQFFLSTLQVLLYRFTGVTDQCIGIIDANRSERTFANTVGYLINTLPLRFFLNDTSRFHDVVKQTQTKMHGAMANADVPFSKIIEKLKIPRTSSHAPLFQILVNYRLGALEQTRIGDCDLSDMEGQVPKTPFDLTALIVEKAKGECLLQFDVQNYLYSKEDSLQLLRSYAHILEVMSQTSDTPISDCEIFSPAMRKESLRFSQGAISLQSDRSTTIWSLIDAQTRLAPQDIAMKDSYGTNMSYRSVQSKVNAIISKFRSENIKPLSTIALLCEPSADAICGLLAIWAYGATCVPLDLCNPIPRLNAMIQECSPTSLLFHSKSRDSLAGIRLGDASSIDVGLEGAEDEEYEGSRSEFDCSIDPQSLALILYTSGSTGRPKGVGLTHLNLLNCISGMEQTLNLGKEVVLQQSSLGFDLAVAQIAVALTRSGTLVIASRAQRGDAIELSRLMRSEGVSFTFCVPSEYAILLRFGHRDLAHCRNWRLAISAGERLTAQLKREFCKLKSEVELVNAYGPTETTIISHLTKICYKPKQGMHEQETSTSEELLHVGRPLPNVLTYIVDEAGQLMPIGFPGEVYIGGLGVSPGYYRDQELTQGSFLPDVFIPNGENALEWHVHRLYRSGDRGRLLANGSLVPLGRVDGDQQIKLRGMRVDLESIESSIVSTSHGIVQEAIVVQRGEPAFLAGFVVFGDVKISSNSRLICQRILTELPEAVYMRPAVLIPLETLPRNANGKTDRVALQSAVIERDFGHSEVIADSAFTAFETTLMKLWRQLLFYDDITPLRISRSTDFFAAGGSSLLLVELQNLIHGEFQVLVPLKDLFISSSIEKMSIRIRDGVKSSISSHRIDWDTETAIPQAILDLSASIEQKPRIKAKRQGLRVGLTGAFGYLGGVILDELVAEPAIAKIDCLAIRPRPVGHIHNCSFSQVQSNKIKIHGGDLSKPLLGLSDSIFHELSDTLDAIVHNGADVSFLKDYAGLRAANVDSTKELIRMSMSRKIPIHYVSTTGIAQLLPQEAGEKSRILTPLPSSQLPHPRANVSAYIASKYVSERLLERACSQLCIPVCVYRPSNIVRTCPPGDVEVGRMEKDLLGALLSYSRAIGKVPILNRWSGDVDFVSLGNVAKTVVSKCLASIHDQPCFTTGAMRIVHLCGEHTAPINELSSLIQDREVGLDKIELDVWLCLAKAKGLSDAMGATIQHLSCEHLNLARIKEGEQVW